MEKNLYLLQLELSKWKDHTILMEKGMISLSEHRRIIQELKDKWDEELYQWDNLQKELQELRNIKFLKEEKEQLGKEMYNLIQELLRCRAPSPSYRVFLYEHMVLLKIRALK